MLNTSMLLELLPKAIVLFTAMPIHECAHGYAAHKLGDNTARDQGRLTLNPFAHLDPIGSLMILVAGFGWARPVPIDTRRFAHPRRDMALSALAGPLSNLMLALLTIIVCKLLYTTGLLYRYEAVPVIYFVMLQIVLINLSLAVFNLLPMPPLDGFKVFGSLLPDKAYFWVLQREHYVSMIILLIVIVPNVLNFTSPVGFIIGFFASRLLDVMDFITRPLGPLLIAW